MGANRSLRHSLTGYRLSLPSPGILFSQKLKTFVLNTDRTGKHQNSPICFSFRMKKEYLFCLFDSRKNTHVFLINHQKEQSTKQTKISFLPLLGNDVNSF